MTWKKPNFPRQLTVSFVSSSFNRLRKREIGESLKTTCAPAYDKYRAVPWRTLEMKDLVRHKMVNQFDKEAFQQIFTDARAVIDNETKTLADECASIREQVSAMEAKEDDPAAKKIFSEMIEQADLMCQALSKETLEEFIQSTHDQHMANLSQQVEQRFKRLKDAFVKIVNNIKKVIDLEFDASSHSDVINTSLTFGYSIIQNYIKDFAVFVEKGVWVIDIDTYRKELEPITKFSDDKSLFAFDGYSDAYERDIKLVANEDTEAEDVKKHCISILKAVRELPSRYKE